MTSLNWLACVQRLTGRHHLSWSLVIFLEIFEEKVCSHVDTFQAKNLTTQASLIEYCGVAPPMISILTHTRTRTLSMTPWMTYRWVPTSTVLCHQTLLQWTSMIMTATTTVTTLPETHRLFRTPQRPTRCSKVQTISFLIFLTADRLIVENMWLALGHVDVVV